MRKTCLVLLLFLSVGLGSTHAILTTTETHGPQNWSFPLSPGGETLQFPQFDTVGGTLVLVSVSLELNANAGADITATNDSTIEGNVGVVLSGNVAATSNGLSAIALLNKGAGPVLIQPAATHDFGNLSDSGSDSDNITSGLAPFIGAGTVDVDVAGNGGFAFTGDVDVSLGISNFAADGDATIIYEYYEIPEPMTMGLLGLGTLALMVRRRRA